MMPTLHPEQPEDAAFLYRLFVEARSATFAALPLGRAGKGALLQQQFDGQAQYKAHYPHAAFSVVMADTQAIGRLCVDRSGESLHVVDGSLLRALKAEAAMAGRPVTLHVERSNPAQRLYRRLGFQAVGGDGVYLKMAWRESVPA